MRFNHSLCPDHLYRFNMTETNVGPCSPDEIADLNHIFLSCTTHKEEQNKLYKPLIANNRTFSTTIQIIISGNNEKFLTQFTKFLEKI